MLQPVLFVLVGLGVLLASGEALVRGAAGLARILKIPPLVVGLTIVAFGTSAPELVVTIRAVMADAGGIAMGNIVGSNIANIFLVLGLPAILTPICMTVPRLKRHGFFLLGATALFCGLVYRSGQIGPFEGLCLAGAMCGYLALMIYEANHGNPELAHEAEELTSHETALPKTLLFILIGLVGLPVGATLLVENGTTIAKVLDIRDELIGLTVVAFGTSLPELATVLAAALKKETGVVAGSIVGSNIFNLLFVGAAAGLVGTSAVTSAALRIDLPVMIIATLLVGALIIMRGTYGRMLGILTTLLYVGYIAFTGTASA